MRRREAFVSIALVALVVFVGTGCGGGGGGGGGNGADPIVPTVAPDPTIAADTTFDLSGTWQITDVNRSNTWNEPPETDVYNLFITHNVATGAVTGTYNGGLPFTGTYANGVLTFDVPYQYRDDDEDDGAEAYTTVTQVTVHAVGATSISGVSVWSWDRVIDDQWDGGGINDWTGVKL